MKELGKIYSLISLFSDKEKTEHEQCNSVKEALKNFDKLIGKKIEKLAKDLEDTNLWKVEESKDGSSGTIYFVKYLPSLGKYRNPISEIKINGNIHVYGDKKLDEFLLNYQCF